MAGRIVHGAGHCLQVIFVRTISLNLSEFRCYIRVVLAACLTTILFSISVMCGHRSAKLIGGTEANFWRLAFSGLFLGLWSCSFGTGVAGPAFLPFFWSGVLGIGLGDIALFQALPQLGPQLSSLVIQCLTAPFGALLEWYWRGTLLTPRQIICVLAILLGVGCALATSKGSKLDRRSLVNGTIFAVLAALGGAFGAVLSREAYAIARSAGQHVDGASAAFQRVVPGLMVAGVGLLIVKRRELQIQSRMNQELAIAASKNKWRRVWPWVLANSLAGQTIGVSFMQRALETTPTGIVLAIIAVTPIVVIPFSFAFENERPTFHSIFGGVIAVAGVVCLILS